MPGSSAVGTAGKLVALLAAFVATSVVAGVLVAGLFMPAVGATGTVARSSVDFFDSLPEELEPQPLSQQSRILWADGSVMATFYDQNRIVVPLSSVAPVLRQAVIAIEDERFYEHGGVDVRGISRAFVNNFSGGDTQGASTLTQQWVKNVLADRALREGGVEAYREVVDDDYGRKVREAKLAIAAEKRLTKDQILENYLNIALFGDGQYGVATAANHFFGKNPADLTLPEAALLAGMIQRPRAYDPVANPETALQRRDVVLQKMLELEYITRAQYDEAVAIPLEAMLNVRETPNGCAGAGNAAFFCEYVIATVLQDQAFGETPEQRQQLVYRGGLTITTTLDKTKQAAADEAVKAKVAPGDPAGSALASVEAGTGRILAMAQSKLYDPSEEAGPEGTSYNYAVDASMGGPPTGFQVGSTYKPFVLATWLRNGNRLSERVAAPRSPRYDVQDFERSCVDRVAPEVWEPRNSEGQGGGRITVLEATYRSVNTAYTEMARELDLCEIRDVAASLGVHRTDGGELGTNPSSVLGDNVIAPLTMASAFATFANSGTYCRPVAITEVKNSAGEVIGGQQPECSPAMEPDIANAVATALTNTLDRGTARRSDIDWPAAGKTGTTNESWETWFVGFTRQISTAVWVGTPNAEPTSLNGLTFAGERHRRVYGGTVAAPIWQAYMSRAMEGLPAEDFPTPPSRFLREPAPPPPPPATRAPQPEPAPEPPKDEEGNRGRGGGGGGGNPEPPPGDD
ncbi:MAG: transglycosylase domain-containing protein [Actinomycetes bacterium]